jgi:hypothetical protein
MLRGFSDFFLFQRVVRPLLSCAMVSVILGIAFLALAESSQAGQPGKPLEIYFVDVEGGQATLFVTPEGQSLLIDTGWPGNAGRDADRIVAAAKKAGLSKIDFVLLTHTWIMRVARRNCSLKFPWARSSITAQTASRETLKPSRVGRTTRSWSQTRA